MLRVKLLPIKQYRNQLKNEYRTIMKINSVKTQIMELDKILGIEGSTDLDESLAVGLAVNETHQFVTQYLNYTFDQDANGSN